MKRALWTLLLVSLILALVACEGGTSGSVIGSSESCSQRGDSGSCKGRYRTLRGSYGADIEHEGMSSFDTVKVQVEVTVESGNVSVSIETPDGEHPSVTVAPGSPGTLVGLATGETDGFEVRFEAVDGEASGVSYTVVYEVQ
ncbi:MAG: hypothetical protein ACK2VA_08080 [Anaerolineae bacterium]|jgi:hypothetical protein